MKLKMISLLYDLIISLTLFNTLVFYSLAS